MGSWGDLVASQRVMGACGRLLRTSCQKAARMGAGGVVFLAVGSCVHEERVGGIAGMVSRLGWGLVGSLVDLPLGWYGGLP